MVEMVTNEAPSTFISKLWKLVNDEENNGIISWSSEGQSFAIHDEPRFTKELLPISFKHSKLASFVRQLNLYGFRKINTIEKGMVENSEMEFYHQYFNVHNAELLPHIKRKKNSSSKPTEETSNLSNYGDLVEELEIMHSRQDYAVSMMREIQNTNKALGSELKWLKEKSRVQQELIEKLLNFLVSSIMSNQTVKSAAGAAAGKRKAHLIFDKANLSNALKMMKGNDGVPQHTIEDSEDEELVLPPITARSPSPSIAHRDPISKLSDAFKDGSLKLALARCGEMARIQQAQPQPSSSTALVLNNNNNNKPFTFLSNGTIDPSMIDTFLKQFYPSDL